LKAQGVTLAYENRVISEELSVAVPDNSFTVIVGPNACGKSTLLRALSRLLSPSQGKIVLDGKDLAAYRPKEAARLVGLLPQSSTAPEGITVEDLVGRGRYPHQGFIRQWSAADQDAVDRAMAATNIAPLASRRVEELSGGQRQRVWAAMALAQETDLLLLDEPTTYLDIAHQIDLLDLFADLHEQGRTLVAVLHDLNMAARYATRMVLMSEGSILAEGAAEDVLTTELLEHAFGLRARVIEDPENGRPMVVPLDRRRRKVRTEGAA
jgi:iron complex transport system ATP-binding protein